MDSRLNTYKEQFVIKLWDIYPGWASSVGYHKYDHILVVPDDDSRNKELEFCSTNLDSLKKFNLKELSDVNKTDYYLIENQLKSGIWSINKQKAYEWDPSGYNVSGSFADMLGNDYEALDKRLNNFYLKMAAIPAYYKAAMANIKNPTKEHTALAIEQNMGGISVFEQDLPEALKKSGLDSAAKQRLDILAKRAIAAIKENEKIAVTKNLFMCVQKGTILRLPIYFYLPSSNKPCTIQHIV